MKAKNFDQKFERSEDMTIHLDLAQAKRASRATKRINVDFPLWTLESLDRGARRLGVTRQSIIKIWMAERLDPPRRQQSAPFQSVSNPLTSPHTLP